MDRQAFAEARVRALVLVVVLLVRRYACNSQPAG